MTELGRAGFSPKQIEEMTLAVMNLAPSHWYRCDTQLWDHGSNHSSILPRGERCRACR